MINRREVLASGVAASLLVRSPAAAFTGEGLVAGGRGVPPFVIDTRFAEARTAARAAEGRGAAIRPQSGDVTPLYESLDQAWRSAAFAIAGVTTKHALFVVERLAWERGLCTLYRGSHRRAADGRFEHELHGAPALVRRIDSRSVPDWSLLGQALAEWAAVPVGARRRVASQTVPGVDGATLASWLLVPANALDSRA